jgi:hypothetical protein
MGKIIKTSINSFSGGVAEDPRENSSTKSIISKHFDIFSQPNRLIPYRNLVADTDDGSTSTGMKQYKVLDTVYASGSTKQYGLGQTVGGLTKIVYKADATTLGWTLPSSSEGSGAVRNGCLVEYKDYLWGFQGSVDVFKWGTLSGSPSITNSAGTVGTAISSVAQGIIAKDDSLYLPYNNKLVRVTAGGTVQDAVLTLPTNYKITSIDNYGNYLAIACAPVSTYNGVSKVFLWNLTSTDVQETYDLGAGEIRVLGVIESMIVTISDVYLNNTVGAGRGSMVIKVLQGSTFQPLKEIFTQSLVGKTIPLYKAVKNNRLFFSAKLMTNSAGTEYNEGIWSFGRKNVGSNFALSLDIIDENINTSGIQAFGVAGNFFYISHSADGSIDSISSTATYTFTSIYQTLINSYGDVYSDKKLNRFTIGVAPITTGTFTLKYRINSDTSWTTIGTLSTVGEIAKDFFAIESTDTPFPLFNEIEFRLESTGGVEIIGYETEVEILIGSTG